MSVTEQQQNKGRETLKTEGDVGEKKKKKTALNVSFYLLAREAERLSSAGFCVLNGSQFVENL